MAPKRIIAFIALVLLAGLLGAMLYLISESIPRTPAEEHAQEVAALKENAERLTGQIEYVKDSRTGLCFAVIPGNDAIFSDTSIANVPCTPQVEKLAQEGIR